jgi:hypothetical protein
MIVKTCLECKYHAVKMEDGEQTSHCSRENCWSRYSKCILSKALEIYLKENSQSLERYSVAI